LHGGSGSFSANPLLGGQGQSHASGSMGGASFDHFTSMIYDYPPQPPPGSGTFGAAEFQAMPSPSFPPPPPHHPSAAV